MTAAEAASSPSRRGRPTGAGVRRRRRRPLNTPCTARSRSTSTLRRRSSSRWPTTSSAGRRSCPHYTRSMAVDRRDDGSVVADFVARRPLIGVLGLGLPVTWRSRTWNDPVERRLRFVHVAGATRGMDVTWRIRPTGDGCRVTIEHDFAPRRARRSRPSSIGGSRGRSPGGRWRRSRPSPRPSRPRRRTDDGSTRHDRTPTGLDHRDRDRDPHRDGRHGIPRRPARRPVPGAAHRSLRSLAVPVAGRGAGRRLRPRRLDAAEDRPTARSVQPVRDGRRPSRARRCQAHTGCRWRGAPRADRDLPRFGARGHRLRRGAARALPGEGHPPGRPEPRAGRLRRRRPGQPRDRARRPRSDPVDGQLLRLGRRRPR